MWKATRLAIFGLRLGVILGFGLPAYAGTDPWLEQSTFVASSLETGRIGYLDAAGTGEYGYAYSYALSGQPSGVSVDADTGILSISTPLGVGSYAFNAVVTDRIKASNPPVSFPVTLTVVQGVTANRTGNQILHKTYAVDSGAYGSPNGQDYTNVFTNMRQAIIQDQIAAGDGNLRATIYLRRGYSYDYTNNDWPGGLQYFTVQPDPSYNPTGPRPRLRNIHAYSASDYPMAILWTGGGTVFDELGGQEKANSLLINTVMPGSNTVQLKNSADASKIMVGRWYMVGSYDQQVGGFPANMRYHEWVKVLSVSNGIVTLDRKLRHTHRDSFYEKSTEPQSMGVARLIPMDVTGAGGIVSSYTRRLTIRETFKDIEFLQTPAANPSWWGELVYSIGGIDVSFENCVIPQAVPSQTKNMRYLGGTIGFAELDKLIETVIFDGVSVNGSLHSQAGNTGDTLGASGVNFFLIRNMTTGPLQISPRQLRMINSTIDATNDTYLWLPLAWQYIGPIMSAELQSTTLLGGSGHNPVMPSAPPASLTITSDASWSGDRLIIPSTSSVFMDWEVSLFEGMIVYAGSNSSAWGVVRTLSAPADNSAIWVDIQWMAGNKPLSGTLRSDKTHRLIIDANSKLGSGSTFGSTSGGFMSETVPPSFGASWAFPVGYPASDYGF